MCYKNNIIVLDFDNTLLLSEDKSSFILPDNFKNYELKIKSKLLSIINKNNYIIINTGRSFNSFKKLNTFPYSFLICNNGSEYYDTFDNLLKYIPLVQTDIKKFLTIKFDKNSIIKIYTPKNILNAITGISITINNSKIFTKTVKSLINLFDFSTVFFKYPKIRIVNTTTDKEKALEDLINIRNIKATNIFAIGDDDNDYELLKKYTSYTFPWNTEKIKSLELPTYNNLLEILKNIEYNYEK